MRTLTADQFTAEAVVEDIVADPQYQARGMIATVPDPDLGNIKMVGIVPRIPEAPGAIR